MATLTRSAAHPAAIPPADDFSRRHIGPSEEDVRGMLEALGFPALEAFIAAAVPASIRTRRPLELASAASEHQALQELRSIASKNRVLRSLIGAGYHDCVVPPVILRNVLENPGWYTQYTPYQAEIAQGRLEALLNFQTMVCDLTGLEVSNASLLDEATAAAEAMALCRAVHGGGAEAFLVAEDCHPQTIAVVRTRAEPLGARVVVGRPESFRFEGAFGMLLQNPATDGTARDYTGLIARAREAGVLSVIAADILSLAVLKTPGEMGADAAVGSTQRFGVPMGYGGPHAAYLAARAAHVRQLPGRLVGVSRDAAGRPALRLAVQTREQHIRREKATSNICTAQVLLAVMASMYAVYHGPEGIARIAWRVHRLTAALAAALRKAGWKLSEEPFFDTLKVLAGPRQREALERALARGFNLRALPDGAIGISLDEKTDEAEAAELAAVFDAAAPALAGEVLPAGLLRRTPYLTHPVFRRHRCETEMLRYLHRLQAKDLSLTTSMIPLGSCTMKLNAAAEMLPVTWPELGGLHPAAPEDQALGYREIFAGLERALAEITGFAAVSLQPNAGSQGEFAGLLAIRAYHQSRGEGRRDVCLIPQSAHGTNPASAAMAGMRIVVVRCDERGNIDPADLKAKAEEHKADLAALMVTYPSTHGVFEEGIKDLCAAVHAAGGQVYMDGANLNAQVGLCRPAELGADVCHLNLHKTFCIPHGGGGPGMGPIAVAGHLAPFLPGRGAVGPVSAAPWGSPSILAITWMYIRMMGGAGLRRATETAILNANYAAKRLAPHYPVLYKADSGLVAHECILDLRNLKSAGVTVEDVAKRLIDYGFHAPTVSWPVAGTMMVEPTESETKAEIDRFCEAMIAIREEARLIESGKLDPADNPLKNAPHTAQEVVSDGWKRPYSREQAAYPAPWLKEHKYWAPVSRVDNPYGDRNLVCSCPPVEEFDKKGA